jgi:hypothetical protein
VSSVAVEILPGGVVVDGDTREPIAALSCHDEPLTTTSILLLGHISQLAMSVRG